MKKFLITVAAGLTVAALAPVVNKWVRDQQGGPNHVA